MESAEMVGLTGGAPEPSLLEARVRAQNHGTDVWQHLQDVQLVRMLVSTASQERSHSEGIARLAGIKRLQAWASAMEYAQLTQLAGAAERTHVHEFEGRAVAVHDALVGEIALATRSTEADVRRDLATARMLETSLPDIQAGLASGQVNAAQARTIATAAERLPEAKRAELGAVLLPDAATANPNVLRAHAERTIHAIDPDGDEARRQRAASRRSVWCRDEEDGNSMVFARLATVDAHACMHVIAQRAARLELTDAAPSPLASETKGQRLARAFTDVLLGPARQPSGVKASESSGAEGADGDTQRDARPAAQIHAEVFVTVSLQTLLGLQDEPITVDGCAPADVEQLRDLLERATDVEFRRVITDDEFGSVLDVSRRAYRPTDAMRRHVQARDGCCQWPGGCRIPAHLCDIDHMTPYDAGGDTHIDNLLILCRWHHLLKTFHGYTAARDDTGLVIWTTPT